MIKNLLNSEIMDNPSYFHPCSQPSDLIAATLRVDDNEARKTLDHQLSILSSRISNESPSLKLVKKCSLRKFLSPKGGRSHGLELKRSQSLTHEETNVETSPQEFAVERSKSFSTSWANPKMTHENVKRNSIGSCRPHAIAQGEMTSTHQRPPLPPNFRSLNQDSYRFKAVLRSNIPDVAIIYSNTCTVSCEWAVYITNLMKNQGYKTILVHEVESFSAASTPDVVLRNKDNHPQPAKAQIVILGQSLLDWVFTHPKSSIGNLFKDSTKVIGLLLGITKDHVKAEHRAELLTFAVWKFLLNIKANDHEQLSQTLVRAVSSMMPNSNFSYVMPRPMRKFRVWPQPVQGRVLFILNEKISALDKIQVTLEVFDNEINPTEKMILENKNIQLITEMSIEINLPQNISRGFHLKFKLETNGLYWHPHEEKLIPLKQNPLSDLDKHLSNYLNQSNSGAIQIQDDPKLPTLLHFAVQNNMSQSIQTLLSLPGGQQMAAMPNSDGLNAREMAVHAGNLQLANLLKDPQTRPNYELPVLKPKPNNNNEEIYDIPRKTEQCYIVPPAPRPLEVKMKYVSMNKSQSKTEMMPPSQQSRQELLRPLFKASSMEELHEPKREIYVNVDVPRSPLDIVNPFPLTFAQQASLQPPNDVEKLKNDLALVQAKIDRLSLSEKETKFEEWKSSPFLELALKNGHAKEVEELTAQWEEMLNEDRKSLPEGEKSFRQKFRQLIKSKKRLDEKYSTLPSMPIRLKRKSSSENSPRRNKSSSVSETNRTSESSECSRNSSLDVECPQNLNNNCD